MEKNLPTDGGSGCGTTGARQTDTEEADDADEVDDEGDQQDETKNLK